MTNSARRLLGELKSALEELPREEQEERVASYVNDVHQRKQAQEATEDPYSALKILRDARLGGPEDASVTYEEKLYGLNTENGDA